MANLANLRKINNSEKIFEIDTILEKNPDTLNPRFLATRKFGVSMVYLRLYSAYLIKNFLKKSLLITKNCTNF